MRNILFGLLGLLFVSCEQPATKGEKVVDAPNVVTAPSTSSIITEDSPQEYWEAPTSTDTLLTLEGQRYHLRLQAALDSTKHLIVSSKVTPNPEDRARGYDGYFTVTLTDSLNQQVFKRQFRKADFFQRVGEEVVIPSGAATPTLLGYSAPMGALILTLGFAVPDTDWGSEVIVLLDLKGNVLRMSDGNNYGGGADCSPTLSNDGRTLLTTSEVLRAQQSPIQLNKPHAELRGAFFLNDTVLVTLYELGDYKQIRTSTGNIEEQFITSKKQQTTPNAFIKNVRNNRNLSKFRYNGYFEELGYIVPRHYLSALKTWYLLDERKGLYLLESHAPDKPTILPFPAIIKFTPPQRPAEIRFEQQGMPKQYAFYVDTLAPKRIRYQLLTN